MSLPLPFRWTPLYFTFSPRPPTVGDRPPVYCFCFQYTKSYIEGLKGRSEFLKTIVYIQCAALETFAWL